MLEVVAAVLFEPKRFDRGGEPKSRSTKLRAQIIDAARKLRDLEVDSEMRPVSKIVKQTAKRDVEVALQILLRVPSAAALQATADIQTLSQEQYGLWIQVRHQARRVMDAYAAAAGVGIDDATFWRAFQRIQMPSERMRERRSKGDGLFEQLRRAIGVEDARGIAPSSLRGGSPRRLLATPAPSPAPILATMVKHAKVWQLRHLYEVLALGIAARGAKEGDKNDTGFLASGCVRHAWIELESMLATLAGWQPEKPRSQKAGGQQLEDRAVVLDAKAFCALAERAFALIRWLSRVPGLTEFDSVRLLQAERAVEHALRTYPRHFPREVAEPFVDQAQFDAVMWIGEVLGRWVDAERDQSNAAHTEVVEFAYMRAEREDRVGLPLDLEPLRQLQPR